MHRATALVDGTTQTVRYIFSHKGALVHLAAHEPGHLLSVDKGQHGMSALAKPEEFFTLWRFEYWRTNPLARGIEIRERHERERFAASKHTTLEMPLSNVVHAGWGRKPIICGVRNLLEDCFESGGDFGWSNRHRQARCQPGLPE